MQLPARNKNRESDSGASTSKELLRILPEEAPLRSESPFLEPGRWPIVGETEDPPRALKGLAKIVDGGLCHRCGSCIGICPTDVLSTDEEGFPFVKSLSACTDCDLCVKVCPGDEFDYHRHHLEKFEKEGDIRDLHGHFEDSYIAYSTRENLRAQGTSGGLVTEILLHLIETDQIDGAVVIAADENVLWKGKPVIARTKEEILATVKSKYAISPTNSVFSEIRKIEGRYALVGLPCQIHGFVKAAELDPRLKERVVLTVGLFCHAAVEHESYEVIWGTLGDKRAESTKFISRVGKHPGTPHVVLKDGALYPVYFGNRTGYRPSSMEIINILYRLYSPPRCLTCFDALSEFADISVGDPWMPPPEDDVSFYDGWSFALIRNQRGKAVFNELVESKKIAHRSITRNETRGCNNMMASEKKWRAFRIIETHKRQGKAIPSYGPFGMEMPKASGMQFLKTEINMLTHFLCFLPRYRASVLKFMLGNGGYYLLWLNSIRRRTRVYLRDTFASLKRRVLGRR